MKLLTTRKRTLFFALVIVGSVFFLGMCFQHLTGLMSQETDAFLRQHLPDFLSFKAAELVAIFAELLVAFVIFYELEENRMAAFLKDALGGHYDNRGLIYDAFVGMEGATLRENAVAFKNYLERPPEAGEKDLETWKKTKKLCDKQLSYLASFRYMLRFSPFHRGLMETWFPQVLVRLWLMLGPYAESRQPSNYRILYQSVLNSVERCLMIPDDLEPIYGTVGDPPKYRKVDIRRSDLEWLRGHLQAKIAQGQDYS